MTEPVAYLVKSLIDLTWSVSDEKPKGAFKYYKPLYTSEQLHPRVKMTQAEFDELEKSLINAQFDYSELKKTIEIVQTKKWFVRSKKEDENGSYQFLFFVKKLNGYLPVEDELDNSGMKYFDTKEEAELWVNPLTEAVRLPVEEKT